MSTPHDSLLQQDSEDVDVELSAINNPATGSSDEESLLPVAQERNRYNGQRAFEILDECYYDVNPTQNVLDATTCDCVKSALWSTCCATGSFTSIIKKMAFWMCFSSCSSLVCSGSAAVASDACFNLEQAGGLTSFEMMAARNVRHDACCSFWRHTYPQDSYHPHYVKGSELTVEQRQLVTERLRDGHYIEPRNVFSC